MDGGEKISEENKLSLDRIVMSNGKCENSNTYDYKD